MRERAIRLWKRALEMDYEDDARDIVQTLIDEAVRNHYVDAWESLAHEQRSQEFPFEILFVDDDDNNPGLIECQAGMIRMLQSLCDLDSSSSSEEDEEEEESTYEHVVSLWLKLLENGLSAAARDIVDDLLMDAVKTKCISVDQVKFDNGNCFCFSLLFPEEDDEMSFFNFQAELVTRLQDLLESNGAPQKKDFIEHQLDKQFPIRPQEIAEKFTQFCRNQVQKGVLIDSHEQWLDAFCKHLKRKVLKHAKDGHDSTVDALEKLITESDVSQPSVYEEYVQKLKTLKEESPAKRIRV